MRDEHDCLADLLLKPQELGLQPVARHRVDRAERLVHQQHRRVGGERPRDAHPLSLAAGQLVRVSLAVQVRVEADQSISSSTRLSERLESQPSSCGTVAMLVADGLVGEQPDLLDDVADPPAKRDRVDVLTSLPST